MPPILHCSTPLESYAGMPILAAVKFVLVRQYYAFFLRSHQIISQMPVTKNVYTHMYTQLSNTCRYIYAPDEVNLLPADLQSLCNYCRCSGRGRRTVWYSATTKFRLHSVCVAYVIYWFTV